MRKPSFIASISKTFSLSLLICLMGGSLSFCNSKTDTPPAAEKGKKEIAAKTAKPANPAPTPAPASAPAKASINIDSVLAESQTGTMNYSINLKPFAGSHKNFGEFKGKNLLMFYFSPTCPHCQESFPHVQKLGDELTQQGFVTISVATANSSPHDIHKFMAERKSHVSMFQDAAREVAQNYGTGYVPVVLLVNAKGEYTRFSNFDPVKTVAAIKEQIKRWN